MEVDLGGETNVALVELWKAERDCAAVLSAQKPRNVRCKSQQPVESAFDVEEARPLRVELKDGGGAVVARREFQQARGVYAWRVGGAGGGEGVAARSVRVSLAGGGAPRQLALAEILVYEAGVGGDATAAVEPGSRHCSPRHRFAC